MFWSEGKSSVKAQINRFISNINSINHLRAIIRKVSGSDPGIFRLGHVHSLVGPGKKLGRFLYISFDLADPFKFRIMEKLEISVFISLTAKGRIVILRDSFRPAGQVEVASDSY